MVLRLARNLQSVAICGCLHVGARAFPDICFFLPCERVRGCGPGRQRCAVPLTKQAGWMSIGCDSDNGTPHYQVPPAEKGGGGGMCGGDE